MDTNMNQLKSREMWSAAPPSFRTRFAPAHRLLRAESYRLLLTQRAGCSRQNFAYEPNNI